MGRPALQPDEIHAFRERLCDAALHLFAEHGYDGFTLRALGDALGCSPATPYRYFENKAEIYAAVCERAFEALCRFQEEAGRDVPDVWEGIRRQGRSYVAFTRQNPHAYRVMFDLRDVGETRALIGADGVGSQVRRSWELLFEAFDRAHQTGELDGDPQHLALSFWASIHGVMSLELGGRIIMGASGDDLVAEIFDRFERAYGPGGRSHPPFLTGDPS